MQKQLVKNCPKMVRFVIYESFVRRVGYRTKMIFLAFMIRLSCVYQTFSAFIRLFVRSCPDFRAFFVFPNYVSLNARHPRRALISVVTYRLSIWDLNLGCLFRFHQILASPDSDCARRPLPG